MLRVARSDQYLVLLDSQPYSEFGKKLCGILRSDGSDGYSRPKFPANVAKQLKKHGLWRDVRVSTDTSWVCKRAGRPILTYLMSMSIPHDLDVLAPRLVDVSTLFVAGHHPHGAVLEVLPRRPLHFIGQYGTCYGDRDSRVRDAFADYTYYDRCGDAHVFIHWDQFVILARSKRQIGAITASGPGRAS